MPRTYPERWRCLPLGISRRAAMITAAAGLSAVGIPLAAANLFDSQPLDEQRFAVLAQPVVAQPVAEPTPQPMAQPVTEPMPQSMAQLVAASNAVPNAASNVAPPKPAPKAPPKRKRSDAEPPAAKRAKPRQEREQAPTRARKQAPKQTPKQAPKQARQQAPRPVSKPALPGPLRWNRRCRSPRKRLLRNSASRCGCSTGGLPRTAQWSTSKAPSLWSRPCSGTGPEDFCRGSRDPDHTEPDFRDPDYTEPDQCGTNHRDAGFQRIQHKKRAAEATHSPELSQLKPKTAGLSRRHLQGRTTR